MWSGDNTVSWSAYGHSISGSKNSWKLQLPSSILQCEAIGLSGALFGTRGCDMVSRENNEIAKLLIVEDDDGARTALGDIFDCEGFPVATCANGREALDYLHSRPLPLVIILDLQMPVMNGWQFCRERKKDANLAAVPVVAITAFQSPGELDVDAVMQKPIDIERLMDLVRDYCRRNRRRRGH